jgi:cbb3-type cytochrome oxidase cytochrome c subunit
MAATDQNYRNQRALDIVFAVSCLLMLASIVWMFVADYNREWKTEQREFRDVESALAQRVALQKLPSVADFKAAKKAVDDARKVRYSEKNQGVVEELDQKRRQIIPDKERSEQRYQSIKADLDSRTSFYDLAVEEHGADSPEARGYKDEVIELQKQLAVQQAQTDVFIQQLKGIQEKKDALDRPVNEAEVKLKKINEGFDLQVRTALQKQWGVGDTIRALPIIDAFNSPTKIHQFTLYDLPIDYNLKYVTRFDRCMSCHKGIDRPGYSRANLEALLESPPGLRSKLKQAQTMLELRKEALEGTDEAKKLPDPGDLEIATLSEDSLTPARIAEFAAHPRIDLFAAANSKHPAEKFGCTICHGGQGSSTSFALASHTPDNAEEAEKWHEAHGWFANHDWEFPMLPSRFVESSCLRCHHEVTDLISSQGNRNEAPKLLRGYNLIKENGCFGCHEIQGFKDGRSIGPDLRTEPTPPLENMSAAERARVTADPNNPPGNLRKVGPSLFRISEKTNPEWVVKWLRAPRAFRPDTKMPHFYGLTNNNPHHLSDEFTGKSQESQLPMGQMDLPDTEIHTIAYYLFRESKSYLDQITKHRSDAPATKAKDEARLMLLEGKGRLSDDEKKEMDRLLALANLRKTHGPIHDLPLAKDYDKGKAKERGRQLFSERGCLACHTHEAVQSPGDGLPAIPGQQQFGPNLSQIKAKLGTKPGDLVSARRWLMYWIKDPHVHSPRSRMPVTHLTNEEVADVAEWLLGQEPLDLGEAWPTIDVQEPDLSKLEQLTRVYLERQLSQRELGQLKKDRKLPRESIGSLPEDEQKLVSDYTEDNIKYFLGKKTVGRLGCFGCHDIPGFENAKPIGVALADWGKKDPGRLAFEDILAFLEDNFRKPENHDEAKTKHGKSARPVYDAYFAEALKHRTREGYLHQKIMEPRSYDYHRLRLWDDRSRMPQFKFARTLKKPGESAEAYQARAAREEQEAREAVMTFVLGLVGEPIPLPYINHPAPDRLAEIRGRQVIDKFNCGGCHLIQPGTFEFKLNDQTLSKLEKTFASGKDAREKDYDFLYHHGWAGTEQTSTDRLMTFGARPRFDAEEKSFLVTLTQALRFRGTDGNSRDIRSSSTLSLPATEMIAPPPEVATNPERLRAYENVQGPLGGTFADLLVNYLAKRDPKQYKRDSGDPNDENSDSADARVAAPPILIGQGERTQPDWLYRFLLDPPRIRKMTVLRMPKFNMSPDEARALVNYFAANTSRNNPGVGITYPYDAVAQQGDFSDPYWGQKTRAYVARLKSGDGAAFKKRVAELRPVWEQILKEQEGQLRSAKENFSAATKRAEAVKNKKDEAAIKEADGARSAWEGEVKRLTDAVAGSSVEKQQAAWEQNGAYVTDAFKLLVNRDLCLGCHRMGNLDASKPLQEQGPPLDIAFERLRPGWTQRWVAIPQRYLTYPSIMPQNFLANKEDYQHLFVGTPLEQVTAVRDVLMAYPRAVELPLNRQWMLPTDTGGKK